MPVSLTIAMANLADQVQMKRMATKATAVRADGSGDGSQPISCRSDGVARCTWCGAEFGGARLGGRWCGMQGPSDEQSAVWLTHLCRFRERHCPWLTLSLSCDGVADSDAVGGAGAARCCQVN